MTENSLYDKKSLLTITSKKIDWKEIVKDVVGFSNAEGGTIEFGIEDDTNVPDSSQKRFITRDVGKQYQRQI